MNGGNPVFVIPWRKRTQPT